tara:strand:+ start:1731 stop:2522 length:792 start_codon:yes stop_codon:yes gene_type:complete
MKFKKDFKILLEKIKTGEHFAFTRFSDGELYILQNRKVVIEENKCFLRESEHAGNWGAEEHKSFIPEENQDLRIHLNECFTHKQHNYFKGICTKQDIGHEDWIWQFSNGLSKDENNLTFANLLINGNYINFMTQMLPAMKDKNYEVVYVCNEKANLEEFPLNLKKDFRIGSNCHINDIHLIKEMTDWVEENNIKNHLFLFSAASLTNLLIYELYKKFPNNTYMDIGSTLNPMLGLDGWKGSRGYLRGYWLNEPNHYFYQDCEW